MRRVRLTEVQLHNVIRESVNQILNELDWKTYENAARKKYDQMDPKDRQGPCKDLASLDQASDDALKRKYPHYFAEKEYGNKIGDMSPEAQKEYFKYKKDVDNQFYGRYNYENGGRGYYVDDEE